MRKSTYHIKETKEAYKFSYSGILEDALEKARRDLEKEKKNPDAAHWEWIKKKAQSNLLSHERKIARLEVFIKCAERNLKEGAEECTKEGVK